MTLPLDLNPILDKGAPNSTGGLTNITRICNIMGIPLTLDTPRARYIHGWGTKCAGAKHITNSWDLTIMDIHGKPTTLTFDVMEGIYPIIIGLDVKRFAITDNTASPPRFRFKRPNDRGPREFHTYIKPDDYGKDRIRMEIVMDEGINVNTMMTRIDMTDLNLVKRLHRFTHAPEQEMVRILSDANRLTPNVKKACAKVYQACDICASSGTPIPKKKISISHVNAALNLEVQAGFVTVNIRNERYEVLKIVDTGTRYGERTIAQDHRGETIMNLLETGWFYHHGPPRAFSADPEFSKGFFGRFLKTHDIALHARPSRSSSKNGKVERNNRVFRNILSLISKEQTPASASTLVARASFMTNLFHGPSTLSAFQLARGY